MIDRMRQATRRGSLIMLLVMFTAALLIALPPIRAAAAPADSAGSRVAQNGEGWRCVEINGQVGLNIRSGPGVTYGVVALRQPGERIEANYDRLQSANGYNWVPVRFTGGEGWAITPRLSPCPGDAAPGGQLVLDNVNDDGSLDRFEIAEVARSVVLVANIQRNRVTATGTGTITTPDGLIVTNAHVVDEAEEIAIAILEDINDPPEYSYLVEVVGFDSDLDVALLAIRYDIDGDPVLASTLDLPYMPSTLPASEVFRGDAVYIFGYPGIGDDYLVVTTGSIVSVENGDINGQRLPVWYRTDAEIAPGNSGGLVVNGNGEFVGIPSFVQTESQTGGRLGGIRPAEVALMAVLDDGQPTGVSQPAQTGPTVSESAVTLEHGTVADSERGITLHLAFTLTGWQDRPAQVIARLFTDDAASDRLINAAAPGLYRDKYNGVQASQPIVPCCEETVYDDLALFIPYSAFGLETPGSYPLKIQVEVAGDDADRSQSWHYTLSWEFIVYSVS